MFAVEVMQRLSDRLKVLKGLSAFWDKFKSLSQCRFFEQYKEFQSIRHDNDCMLDNNNKMRKIMKLMICICSEFC